MSNEIKRGGLYPPIRKTESDDLQEQVKALKQLQNQPAFVAGMLVSKKKDAPKNARITFLITAKQRLITMFKKRWAKNPHSFFKRKHKSVLPSQTKK